jgi:hypothetical protein
VDGVDRNPDRRGADALIIRPMVIPANQAAKLILTSRQGLRKMKSGDRHADRKRPEKMAAVAWPIS